MKSNVPVGAEPLIAERSRLEKLLHASEDWRALQQLRSRTERGEGLSTVSSKNLEAMLVDALAENPFFGPYKSVCLAIERLTNGQGTAQSAGQSAAKAAGAVTGKAVPDFDDLTRIRGVDGNLARRLKDMSITTFAEIAEWRSTDIQRVSSDLGLGKQIYGQNWIEQAALLALTSPRQAPIKQQPVKHAGQPVAGPAVAASAVSSQVSSGLTGGFANVAPAAEPEFDPNQLSLNFSRPAPATAPQPVKSAPVATKPAAPVTDVASAPLPGKAVPGSEPNAPRQKQSVSTLDALRPGGPPPKPLVPWRYGRAPEVSPALPPPRPATQSTGLQPSAVQPEPPKIGAAKPVAISPVLPMPPRPWVITRASLDALPKPSASAPASAAQPVAPPNMPSVPLKLQISATPVPPKTGPPPVVAPSSAPTGAGVPSMSIAEAIAYAAEVAREGHKDSRPDAKRPGPSDGAPLPPASQSKSAPATSPPPSLRDALMQSATPSVSPATAAAAAAAAILSKSSPANTNPPPVLTAREPARAAPTLTPPVAQRVLPPAVPPPLPASFVAPELPPAPQPLRQVRIEHARPVEREDFSNRSNLEEASVEIVRRTGLAGKAITAPGAGADAAGSSAAGAMAAPAAAASEAPANLSQPATDQPNGTALPDKRAPTPMGRFLKALTGN